MAGVIAFATLSLVFTRNGLDLAETVIFACLGAVAVSVFVCRERALVHELAVAERRHVQQLGVESERIDDIYANSVASLVIFAAGTLHIERASSGFFELLGISSSKDLSGTHLEEVLGVDSTHLALLPNAYQRGTHLEEVLGVDSTHLASIVHQIKTGTISVREEIACKHVNGDSIKLLISGRYLPHLHLVEAAFSLVPRKLSSLADHERVMNDLERFKKGIVLRENRVLELKGEVNQLLNEVHQPARYQVDSMTDDSDFVRDALSSKKVAIDE